MNRDQLLKDVGALDGQFPSCAWPGGYPIYYIMDDGEYMCAKCVNNEAEVHFGSVEDSRADGWRVEGYHVAYEGPDTYCCHCNTTLETAYGDPEAQED